MYGPARTLTNCASTTEATGTLVQTAGFPILIPFLFTTPQTGPDGGGSPPSVLVVAMGYIAFGLILAGASLLYSVGLLYLPVSTFTLVSASQLGFNVFFGLFVVENPITLLTPLVLNSVFLLTISSVLLFFQPNDDDDDDKSSRHFFVGFACTLVGSGLFGLLLAVGQAFLNKVLKKYTLREVLDLIVIQSFIATCLVIVGLFASGEWKTLRAEMKDFELGEASYVAILVWTTMCWEMFTVGIIGMLLKVSGLFANVVNMLCVPVVPTLAVAIFHDKMSGVKVISMVLAVWGFVSYAYQQYLDEMKLKEDEEDDDEDVNIGNATSQVVSLVEREQV